MRGSVICARSCRFKESQARLLKTEFRTFMAGMIRSPRQVIHTSRKLVYRPLASNRRQGTSFRLSNNSADGIAAEGGSAEAEAWMLRSALACRPERNTLNAHETTNAISSADRAARAMLRCLNRPLTRKNAKRRRLQGLIVPSMKQSEQLRSLSHSSERSSLLRVELLE